ncbi:MAG: hypothetical protein ABIY62_03860, partial [Ginsengibacter sp.]
MVLILIQTPQVQNFARKKIVNYLENKLKTKVEIGKLRVKFPTSISLQNILLEDRSSDTLLYGGELLVDISMFKLIKKDIEIQEISLNNIVLKVKRVPPDSVFNFQFIADAFASNSSTPIKSKDTSSLKINIDRILVNNTRIIYKDDVTGNDMDLAIGKLDTKISTFDPSHLLFDIPTISLKGLNGHFYQLEPLKKPIEKTVSEQASQPGHYLKFINKEMNFSNINIAYKSEPSNLNSSVKIGSLVLHPKTLDLKNSIITLNDASLENSDFVVQTQSAKTTKKSKDTVLTTPATPSFKIITGDVTVKNTNLIYDNQSMPRAPKGMDFSHLSITGFSLDVGRIQYSIDTTLVSVKSASFQEKSGFVLNNLTTDFEMTPTSVSFQNLDLVMPGTEIKKSALISYPSLAALKKNPALLSVDINIENSKINLKDIQPLLPPASIENTPLKPASTLYVDARVTGKVNDLNFQKLILKGLGATNINVSGVVKGLPNAKKVYADLTINKFQTSRSDILSLVPKGKLPSTITLPEKISANGSIKGDMADLNTNLTINTSLGDAKIVGSLLNITDSIKAQYNLALNASGLQLGTLMQNPKLGVLTGSFRAKGRGYNPATANATFMGDIAAVTLNSYTYRNIKLNGSIANKVYKINTSVNDPNLAANLSANGKFSGKYPAIKIKATIDSIKTFNLHLTSDTISYHGDLDGDFTSTDPDNLKGNLLVTHSILVNGNHRINLDSLQLTADNVGGEHTLSLRAPFMSAIIRGEYKLTQLANVFQQAISPYFPMGASKNIAKVDSYHFTIDAGITDNPALRAFVPSLTELKPVTLNAVFASDSGWNVNMKAPYVVYSGSVINNAFITAGTKDGALAFKVSLKQF